MTCTPLLRLCSIAAFMLLAACGQTRSDIAPTITDPRIEGERYVASDGLVMPLSLWQPAGPMRAVVVAVHGMNDYRQAWARPATIWAEHGVMTYAYDQRGFGGAGQRGAWYGGETLAEDLVGVVRVVRARHPGLPIFVIGESMGSAVAILAATRPDMPDLAGVVLSAPAIWSPSLKQTMVRGFAAAASLVLPDITLPPRRGLTSSSDDPAVMAQLHADPMIIHDTRLQTLAGVVELMEQARQRGHDLRQPVMILYGDDDAQVYRAGVADLATALPKSTVALYPAGRHLLFRSLNGVVPAKDVLSWMTHPQQPLPSGAGERGRDCRDRIVHPQSCPVAPFMEQFLAESR